MRNILRTLKWVIGQLRGTHHDLCALKACHRDEFLYIIDQYQPNVELNSTPLSALLEAGLV
jgi:hypothetical protein